MLGCHGPGSILYLVGPAYPLQVTGVANGAAPRVWITRRNVAWLAASVYSMREYCHDPGHVLSEARSTIA